MIVKGVKLALLTAAVASAAWLPPAQGGVSAGHSGWQWANPLPQGHTIRALELEGSLGYAAGDFGTLLRTDDGGSTWTGLPTGITADLAHVAIIDPDSVVVAGRCSLRRSDNGGVTFVRLPWTPNDDRCSAPIVALAFPADQRGFLALSDGTVLRTDDGGGTWAAQAAIGASQPTAAAFTSADTGVVTTSTGLVYRTADGGASWTLVHRDPHGLFDVTFANTTTGYAVGEGSTVLRTLDGGKTWAARSAGEPLTLTSIRCASVTLCLATSNTGDRVLRTTDAGVTLHAAASTADVMAVAFGPGARAVGAGMLGAIVVSDDAGATWAPVGARLPASFARLRATSPSLAFATGSAGQLARTVDGGRTWQAIGVSTRQDVTDVSFASARVGYAVDLGGRVFRTADAGVSWRRLRPGFPARPQAVLARRDNSVLLIGPHGILRSRDAGGRFVRVRSRAARRAKIFEIDRAGRALFAYGSRRVAASTNGGRSWKTVRRPPRALIAAVDFATRRTGFLLEQNGRLWRTRNGGRRWHDLAGIGSDDAIGLAFSSTRAGYLTLSRFGDDAGGYLLRTTDGGRTWRPQLLTNAPLAAAGVVAKGATDFALAVDGSLFYTSSGGDRGMPSNVRIATARRKLRGVHTIRVSGTVAGAATGAEVVVARRFRRESGWDHHVARVGSNGAFTTTWKMTRTATFVAQWIGDEDRAGDGSAPLRVVVRRRGS
jgi:photosystem II stability/assembly factor-like uncharacterized protein